MLIFTSMFLLLVASAISANHHNKYELRESKDDSLDLLNILQMLSSDPEYQALSNVQKYRILEAMYTMVLNHVTASPPEQVQKRNFLLRR